MHQVSQQGKAEQGIKSKFLSKLKPSPFCTPAWTRCGASQISEGVSVPPAGHPHPPSVTCFPDPAATFVPSEDCALPSAIPTRAETLQSPRPNVPVRGRHSPEPKAQGRGRQLDTQSFRHPERHGNGLFVTHEYRCPCPSRAGVAQMSNETGMDNGRKEQKQPRL